MSTASQKTTIHVGTIGATGHGKSTLTAALTSVCHDLFGSTVVALDKANSSSDNTINIHNAEYDSATRHYVHADSPSESVVKNMTTGAIQMDAAILVCSAAAEGWVPQIREHLMRARLSGVSHNVVFLNKADLVENAEITKQRELELRDLLDECGYPRDDTPIITGSAKMALEGKDDNQMGTSAVKKLVEALDSYLPAPVSATGMPFLMAIGDVSALSGRGTVVTGRVESGAIKVQQEIEIVGLRETVKTVCTGIEMSSKQVQEARTGDSCTIMLGGIKPGSIERGQVLASPDTAKAHTRFEAVLHVLSKEEGGCHNPFYDNYRPQFYFRTIDVTGVCELPEFFGVAMPGENVKLSVTLTRPVAMKEGLRFAMRDGGLTVGAGIVTKILE
ncbi:elongation factor Tu [Pseudomonas sp. NZIPFR-PS5]|nr:elongation factor Tu [Pseudomonas sp. NZIPFR-PS5]